MLKGNIVTRNIRVQSGYEINQGSGSAVTLRTESVLAVLKMIQRARIFKPLSSIRIENNLLLSGGEVRKIVAHLRAQGKPIASKNSKGYWWARSKEEMEPSIEQKKDFIAKLQFNLDSECAVYAILPDTVAPETPHTTEQGDFFDRKQ